MFQNCLRVPRRIILSSHMMILTVSIELFWGDHLILHPELHIRASRCVGTALLDEWLGPGLYCILKNMARRQGLYCLYLVWCISFHFIYQFIKFQCLFLNGTPTQWIGNKRLAKLLALIQETAGILSFHYTWISLPIALIAELLVQAKQWDHIRGL